MFSLRRRRTAIEAAASEDAQDLSVEVESRLITSRPNSLRSSAIEVGFRVRDFASWSARNNLSAFFGERSKWAVSRSLRLLGLICVPRRRRLIRIPQYFRNPQNKIRPAAPDEQC